MNILLDIARRRRRAAMLTALLLATAGATTSTAVAQAPAQQDNGALLLSVGESRVVNLPDNLSDVVIADPAVLDVHVRSQRQIYLIAKAPGQTNVFITTRDGKMLYANAVRVGNNLTNMDQMLKLAMPEANIQIATMNNMLLLTRHGRRARGRRRGRAPRSDIRGQGHDGGEPHAHGDAAAGQSAGAHRRSEQELLKERRL